MQSRELERACGLERERAGEHPVEHDAEGVDVARGRRPLPARLFRGDVGRSAEQGPRVGEGRGVLGPRDAEVGDLRVPLGVEEDVSRLDVAMDQALRMGIRETGGDLTRDPLGVLVRKRPFGRKSLLDSPNLAPCSMDALTRPQRLSVIREGGFTIVKVVVSVRIVFRHLPSDS